MVSEHTLAEIRSRIDIVELIGEYVQLKKSGQGYMGLCPFHGEKTPSFHVHPIKQCFHCFGCHKGGNVFTFVGAVEGLSFPDSVKRLAKRTGVILEERTYSARPHAVAPSTSNNRLLAAQEWAAKYFHYLLNEVPEYKGALDYLNRRGISHKTIQKFRIGVSPQGWSTLLSLMLKRKFSMDELVQSGLVIPNESSPTRGYDRFRNRLMFPIRDPEGATIGFGARLLTNEENQPKYLNSPESPLFSKRSVLYGLHENQRGIRLKGEAVVVEGYMDVVGLYEAGVQNAVATMGTALTENHCNQFKGITRRVVTVFDPDRAGNDAWHRSVHILMQSGLFAKDLSLPDGLDPDEYVLKEGANNFYSLCEKAPRQITKLLREIASKGPLSEEQSARLLQDLTPILIASRRLPDRAILWDDISLVLKVSLAALKDLAEGGRGQEPFRSAQKSQRFQQSIREKASPVPRRNPVEIEFFQASIEWPDEFLKLSRETWLGVIKDKKIEGWLKHLSEASSLDDWQKRLEQKLQTETDIDLLAAASAGLFPEGAKVDPSAENGQQQGQKLFHAIALRLTRRKKESEIKALSAQVKLTQRLGNDDEQLRLLERLKELRASLTK